MDIGGQLSVSDLGAAVYAVKLGVPPGTAGVEPKLSLVYNSQAGNGWLGVGWSLSGLSTITRCPRTLAQDGARGGVTYGANDRFCLDGQRLVAVNGSYGAPGTEYRLELDVFSKVVGYGGVVGDPAYFKVWTKAGEIIEYGNSADSRIEALGKSQARFWAANKVADRKGNYFTIGYTEDTVNGDYFPSRIDYTGNTVTGLAPYNSLQFVYETRPDVAPAYFQGSLSQTTQRLAKIQAYSGGSQVKEYRLTYGLGTTTNRSRIVGIAECALPSNACKSSLSPTWSEYGSNALGAGASWGSWSASFLADVDGDGKIDFITQQGDGLYVALSAGSAAGTLTRWLGNFGSSQGFSDQNVTPIYFTDVNGDGLADVVAFASDGVYVSLSNGAGFIAATKWVSDFGTAASWSSMDTYPRSVVDMDGDGRPDIVGIKNDGIYVALNNGTMFSAATKWSTEFGTTSAVPYSSNSANPRMFQDVDGDGLPDVVGFANGGVYVSLNTGTGLASASLWLADFGVGAGYTNQDAYPRTLADVNGDGLPDVIGFKGDGTYVAINTGQGLQTATRWLADFGSASGYSSQSAFPRYVIDMNGDGKDDLVGFSATGVNVALSTGTGFSASSQWVAGFGSNAGYGSNTLRQLADVDGDGFPDVVAVLNGTNVSRTARTIMPDVVTAIANGQGGSVSLAYAPMTNGSVYTRGLTATYPQADLSGSSYVVSVVNAPNGIGGGYTTSNYQYGGLKEDRLGRGLLGFAWVQTTQADTGVAVRTYYRQDFPYTGLAWRSEQLLSGSGKGGLLRLTTNNLACVDPATGGACSIAAGNRYFPYVGQSTESAWDLNGSQFPTATTNTTFDAWGNATQIVISSSDGFSKTVSNSFTNDSVNWLIGRLVRTQVSSTVGSSLADSPDTSFSFSQTISGTVTNYNLRSAAIANGWDQIVPLSATITVASGAIVGATSTSAYAFDTGSNFPVASTLALTIQNGGYVVGSGGNGGNGGYDYSLFATAGSNGGAAVRVQAPMSIANYGTIGGGGGGGGGGSGSYCHCSFLTLSFSGSGGGGGAGYAVGGGGVGALSQGKPGAPGTLTAGGVGGGVVYQSDYGGNGGNLGSPGGAGGPGTYSHNGAGGAAGAAVVGNSYVTWTATGTRLGAIQ